MVLKKGGIAAYVGINIDITQTKEMEQQLQAERERAEHASLAKARFLANMSHEIRTPMNGVIGFTDLLLASTLNDTQRRHTSMIADSGRAMMALLNDILDISKIEAGQLQIESTTVDLHRKLRHCMSLIEPNAVAKRVTTNVRIAPDVPRFIQGDPLRLRQILLNLLGNAVKFTMTGSITIDARRVESVHGPRLHIAVSDTGQGVPADKLESIFDPFSQADGSTARLHGGSGLGLPISRQLAQKMGGALTIVGNSEAGSTFLVDLPLTVAKENTARTQKHTPAEKFNFAGRRVLVAEDHDINQHLLLGIARNLDLDAVIAADGLEAVAAAEDAKARGTPFDAVLMDVQMPRLDGISATRRLRTGGFTPRDQPIIALSANCYPDDVAACLESGMQDHVGKPVEVAKLARALQKVWAVETTPPADLHEIDLDELKERYCRQRDAVIQRIALALESGCPDEWEDIARELHRIAGTAAYFGQANLGHVSRGLQRAMIAARSDEDRMDLMRHHLEDIRAAA